VGVISSAYEVLNPSDVKPLNRIDSAIRELERYYASAGAENAIGYEFHDESILSTALTNAISWVGEKLTKESEESINTDTQRFMRSMILGTSEGAYFAKDIMELAKDELSNTDIPNFDLIDTMAVRFESWASPDSPINATVKHDDGVGILEQTSAIKPAQTPESQQVEESKVSVSGNKNEDPDRISNPCLSAITVNDVRLTPVNRRTTAASIFFNSIPTIEMSQCAPFIRLTFVSDTSDFIDGMSSLSLIGFLGKDDSGSLLATQSMLDAEGGFPNESALPASLATGNEFDIEANTNITVDVSNVIPGADTAIIERKVRAAGIELFTTPQTMNNMGSVSADDGILNPAAPLASLQRLTVDIAGLGQGILANKTASMEFILHDRSRLPVIAPLIAADAYAGTYVIIEYGWTHPQATGSTVGNVYADFLNSIRDRGIFNIQVADLTMLGDGQVRVNLRLASRGLKDMNTLPVGSGIEEISASLVSPFLSRIVSALDNARAGVTETIIENTTFQPSAENSHTELRNIQLGYAAKIARLKSPQALISIDKYKSLLTNLRGNNKTGQQTSTAAAAAIVLIEEILEEIAEARSSSSRYKTLSNEIEHKNQMLQTLDIFNDGTGSASGTTRAGEELRSQRVEEVVEVSTSGNNAPSPDAPTLGSTLLTFVGTTLQTTLKYEEVQFIFYPFNRQAGAMGDTNIADFRLVGFESFISNFIQNSPSKSINVFMNELFKSDCGPEKYDHPEFGLTDLYAQYDPERLKNLPEAEKIEELADKQDNFSAELNSIYSGMDGPRLDTFVPPDIVVMMECLDARTKVEGSTYTSTGDKTILRVHVFDSKAGVPYEAELLNQIIRQGFSVTEVQGQGGGGDGTPSSNARSTAQSTGRSNRLMSAIDEWVGNHKIKRTPDVSIGDQKKSTVANYVSNVSSKMIKSAIKSVAPSITFGNQFTNVHRISMSSNTSGDVEQVLLIKALRRNRSAVEPSQQASDLEDVFVIPANATLQTAGFPLVSYGQKFYIDMGTGTTADNFYYVVGIRHTITPGSFQSTLTTAYNGSATMKSTIGSMQAVVESSFDSE